MDSVPFFPQDLLRDILANKWSCQKGRDSMRQEQIVNQRIYLRHGPQVFNLLSYFLPFSSSFLSFYSSVSLSFAPFRACSLLFLFSGSSSNGFLTETLSKETTQTQRSCSQNTSCSRQKGCLIFTSLRSGTRSVCPRISPLFPVLLDLIALFSIPLLLLCVCVCVCELSLLSLSLSLSLPLLSLTPVHPLSQWQ
jgi:hypothetical protein